MAVRHKKHSVLPDGADTSKVRPSDWNDDHVNSDGTPVTGMRVIGPYHIAFDTPGLATAMGVVLETFSTSGGFLLDAYFVETVMWAGATAIPMEIVAGNDPLLTGDGYPLWVYGDIRGIPSGNSALDSNRQPRPRLLSVGEILVVDAYGATGMTAGEADIYALIAAP